MSVERKIELVGKKLYELKSIDSKMSIFGSSSHKYVLNKVIPESQIVDFENKYGIKLPTGYRNFLLEIGDGGAGPYYGLQSLKDSLYVDLDYKRENELLDPSMPFSINEPWNMEYKGNPEKEKEYEKFGEEYFDSKWVNGLLRISNFGCGISLNLVVNGQEYGNIWVDDRGNDGGIYPDPYFGQSGKTKFLDWYLLWLEQSLNEIQNKTI